MDKAATSARIAWIDVARCCACMWVYTTHFYAALGQGHIFPIWNSAMVSTLRYGITGKLAVCFFCVLLGYFAARKADTDEPAAYYLCKRYAQLAVPTLIASACVLLCARLWHTGYYVYVPTVHTLKNLVKAALLLRSDLLDTLWCMRDLFLGSLLGFAFTRLRLPCWLQLLLAIVLLYENVVWLGACVLGSVLYALLKRTQVGQWAIWKHWGVQLAICAAAVWVIRRPESITAYKLGSLASFAILFALFNNRRLNRQRPGKHDGALAALGASALWFYCLHVIVMQTLGQLALAAIQNAGGSFVLAFAISFGLCCVLSWALAALCQSGYTRLSRLVTAALAPR